MYQYLKGFTDDRAMLAKPLILATFFGHFLSKIIIKADSSFMSPQKVYSRLVFSFECCFGYPIVGQYFEKQVIKAPKLGQVFIELLDNLPAESILTLPAASYDSKLNLTINILYILTKLLEDPTSPEA